MAPAAPAKRAWPAKKPRRRRQADAAPTTPSCQLMTRFAHCSFERFQWVREERTDIFLNPWRIPAEAVAHAQDRHPTQPLPAHPAWRAAGEILPTRSYRMESLGAFVKENKCSTKTRPTPRFFEAACGRNRRGADGPPPWRRQAADIGRGGRRPPLPVRKTWNSVSWNRELLRENREFLRRPKRVAPRSIESDAWSPWQSQNRKNLTQPVAIRTHAPWELAYPVNADIHYMYWRADCDPKKSGL